VRFGRRCLRPRRRRQGRCHGHGATRVGANALLEAYRAGEQEVHEGEHVEGDKVGLSVVSSAPRLPVRSVPSHQAREGGESEDGVQTFTMPFSVVTWMIVRRQLRCRPLCGAASHDVASVRNPVKPQTNPIQRFIVTALKPSETNPAQSIRYTRLGRKLTRTQETRIMYRPRWIYGMCITALAKLVSDASRQQNRALSLFRPANGKLLSL
jgi:hypothetical protein